MSEQEPLTLVLHEAAQGDQAAANQLMVLVYDRLRALAQRQLGRERVEHTLQATAVVHEVYLNLIDQQRLFLAGDIINRRYLYSTSNSLCTGIYHLGP